MASRPAEEAEGVKSSGGSDSSLSHTASSAGADSAAEVARFGAAKERKHSMEAGIALFNRCAISHVQGDATEGPNVSPALYMMSNSGEVHIDDK